MLMQILLHTIYIYWICKTSNLDTSCTLSVFLSEQSNETLLCRMKYTNLNYSHNV